jgi:hypothetical protein
MGLLVLVSAKSQILLYAYVLSLTGHYTEHHEFRITTCDSVPLKYDFAVLPCLKRQKTVMFQW